MKRFLVKISSIFFLAILLTSNAVSLHIYFHNQIQESGHCKNGLTHCQNEDDHGNEEEAPCDTCILAFNLTNLDYNNNPELSLENSTLIQQIPQKKVLSYVEVLHKKLCLSSNKNKAPPYFT